MPDNPNVTPTQATQTPLPPPVPQQPAGQAPPQAPAWTPPQAQVPAQISAQPPAAQALPQIPAGQLQTTQPEPPPAYVFTQADRYLLHGQFASDVAAFKACGNFTTGYPPLDRIQPFYPGLYCLGAISSLGKTSFALQLADQVAASGRYVVYFSLEQGRFELVSKSLARGFFLKERVATFRGNAPSGLPTPSSIDIRRGIASSAWPQELQAQIDYYVTHVQQRMCIVHGAFSMTVEDIRNVTMDVIRMVKAVDPNAAPPLIVVDYLQIVSPTKVNGRDPDSKTSIDHIVHSLKVLQQQYDLTVLAISSLNRQNYLTPIDFESFKTSGGIEYTADVIWGLQLALMNQEEFYVKTDPNTGKRLGQPSLKEQHDMVKRAKCQSPRDIDLVCLKNRYGISSYNVSLAYYPAHDYVWGVYNPNDPDSLPRY